VTRLIAADEDDERAAERLADRRELRADRDRLALEFESLASAPLGAIDLASERAKRER
jgi:hypothetical protein